MLSPMQRPFRNTRIQVFAVYRAEEIVGTHRRREDAEEHALAIAESGIDSAVEPMWLDAPLTKALLSACLQ